MKAVTRKSLFSLTMIGFLLASGVLAAAWLHATRPPPLRTGESKPPVLVKTHVVVKQDLQDRFVGYGTARAQLDASLASEVQGVVVEKAEGLDDGAHVEAGQVLVRIDDRRYRQQAERANALAADAGAQLDQLAVEEDNVSRLADVAAKEAELNQNELNRVTGLYHQGQAAKREYDFANLAFQQSQRQLLAYRNQLALIGPRRAALEASHSALAAGAELARLDLEHCAITAPFSGEAASVSVVAGDYVVIGSQVLRLMSTRMVEVPVELPASVRSDITIGAECTLEADQMPGVDWKGRVARIAPLTDARSRTFAAYVEVDNKAQERPLTPGQFLTSQVEGPQLKGVLAVPRGSVLGDHVFVVRDDHAYSRMVQVNRHLGEFALVSGDLHPGDEIILTNLDVLREGEEVRTQSVSGEVVSGNSAGGQGDTSLLGASAPEK